MVHVYILFSEKLDRYYVGNTELLPEERLAQHNAMLKRNSFTSKGVPWQLVLVFDCESRKQGVEVEQHIKRMKSSRYLDNLRKYDEMRTKLLLRYRNT
ncbi:GIY-YIG nuclease family protein [Neolewinella sp.]|uniref:GIY-YIG nuclease family protein n=1 Tax=Neolewinella sp. TaxID=2993543 RepID=UPI003B51FB6F